MYERFFGLADAPFRLTPDPRYLFLTASHADALAHLRLGLSESSGFVCITGDVGTGKTTVLRAFLAELGPEVRTAYVINPRLSPLELLQTLATEFGIADAVPGRQALVDRLNAHLLAQHAAGRRCVVVVDEAQALALEVLEELRLLSNLETTTEKLLRIVLVGQPQLRALLSHPELVQLNQRITLRWHIGPLRPAETAAYVRHRLAIASNGQPRALFTRAALRLVHRRSGGVPRVINMLAHRALLAAFVRGEPRVRVRAVRQALAEIASLPLPSPRLARRSRVPIAIGGAMTAAALVLAAGAWRPLPLGERAARDDALLARPVTPATGQPTTPSLPAEPPVAEAAIPTLHDDAVLAERLLAVDAAKSAQRALETVLERWKLAPLIVPEGGMPADFPAIGERRGLEQLALTANTALLRLVDVPAIVELAVPASGRPRLGAVVALAADHVELVVGDGDPLRLPLAVFEAAWTGHTWLFWRDFEGLGPSALELGAQGPRVERLQALLGRIGDYAGPVHGVFDRTTLEAVLSFQRSRYIAADGVVGRLTRLVLYAAVGGYTRPTLAPSS